MWLDCQRGVHVADVRPDAPARFASVALARCEERRGDGRLTRDVASSGAREIPFVGSALPPGCAVTRGPAVKLSPLPHVAKWHGCMDLGGWYLRQPRYYVARADTLPALCS